MFRASDIREVNREEFKLQSIIDLALQTQLAKANHEQLSPTTSRQYITHLERSKEDHRQKLHSLEQIEVAVI